MVSGGEIGVKIVAMLILWLFAAASCRSTLSHPFMWFGLFYVLYGISAPAMIYLNIHPFGFWGGRWMRELNFSHVLDLEFIGLIIVLLVIGPRTYDLRLIGKSAEHREFVNGAYIVLAIAIGLVSLSLAEIFSQGFQSKGEITIYGGWMTRLNFAYNIVVTAMTVIVYKYFTEEKPAAGYVVIAIFAMLAFFCIFVSGQRNFFFRFVLSSVFVLHITKQKNLGVMAAVGFIPGLIFISLLNDQKMAWTGGFDSGLGMGLISIFDVNVDAKHAAMLLDPPLLMYFKLVVLAAFGTELMTASNNLALVIDRVPHDLPYLNGSTLFVTDLVRGVVPGFLLQEQMETTGYIYMNNFFAESFARGEGPGFSMLGAGYMNFGSSGSILVIIIFSLVLRNVYRWV